MIVDVPPCPTAVGSRVMRRVVVVMRVVMAIMRGERHLMMTI